VLLLADLQVYAMSDHRSDNDSHFGQNGNIDDLNNMHMNVIQTTRAIRIPPTTGRVVFHIIRTMIQLLEMKGNFGGLIHKDPHEHLRNFMEVCGPFVFKNISQESIRLRLFTFSLTGEATV